MSTPHGTPTAKRSRLKVSVTRVVPETSLRPLIRDYLDRRARLERQQTDPAITATFRRVLQLQAATLTMVIEDLMALAENRPGRLDRHG